MGCEHERTLPEIIKIEYKDQKEYDIIIFTLWIMGFKTPDKSNQVFIKDNVIYVRINPDKHDKFEKDFEDAYSYAKSLM